MAVVLVLGALSVPSHAPGLTGTVKLSLAAVSVDPATGYAGSRTLVRGSGFVGACRVDLFLDDVATDPIGSAVPNLLGGFSTEVRIPPRATPGPHAVVARPVLLSLGSCGIKVPLTPRAPFTVLDATGYDRGIYLAKRVLVDPGIDSRLLDELATPDGPRHAIVQLNSLLADGDIEALERVGIRLIDYLNGIDGEGTAYLASVGPDVRRSDATFRRLVRGVQRLLPVDKMSPVLVLGDGARDVVVAFFSDVDGETQSRLLDVAGVTSRPSGDPNAFVVRTTPDQITRLAGTDVVQWIEPAPVALPAMDEVREMHLIDGLQQFTAGIDHHGLPAAHYAGLSGDDVQIGVMDSGVDASHFDFAGRLIRQQAPTDGHGTMVSGIAAGSGFQSDRDNDEGVANGGTPFQWRGVAPRADIAAYGFFHDLATMTDAYQTHGVDVSNHSYTYDAFGLYNKDIAALDQTIRTAQRPVIFAAGNLATVKPTDCNGDGTPDAQLPQYPEPENGKCPAGFLAGYFSVNMPCKNCISTGAVIKNYVHAPFSSLGPTPDGRLKPDVSAVGDGITHAAAGNGYGFGGGTSAAAPVVSGVVALMLEQNRKTAAALGDGVVLDPATVKAILVQSATDLIGKSSIPNFDTNQPVQYGRGPDYVTGFGLVNAEAAVQMVEDRKFLVDSIGISSGTDLHPIQVSSGQDELRVSLAWDDRPATPNLNAAARTLVNDLDLTLIDPSGQIHRPLVLPKLTPRDCDASAQGIQVGTCPGKDDPTQNYIGPASPGVDARNNVEQVVIDDPAPGTWQVRVSTHRHFRSFTSGVSQNIVRLPLGGQQSYTVAMGDYLPAEAVMTPDLSAQVVAPDQVVAGLPFQIEVTATNLASVLADDATITLSVSSFGKILGSDATDCTDVFGAALECNVGTIPGGESRTVTFDVQEPYDRPYYHSPVSASWSGEASSSTPDADGSNNGAAVFMDVVSRTDVALQTSFATEPPAKILMGQPHTIALMEVVTNNGPSGPVDADVTITASSGAGVTVSPATASLSATTTDLGEARSIPFEVTVTCSSPGPRVVSVGSALAGVSPGADPDASNDSSELTYLFECASD